MLCHENGIALCEVFLVFQLLSCSNILKCSVPAVFPCDINEWPNIVQKALFFRGSTDDRNVLPVFQKASWLFQYWKISLSIMNHLSVNIYLHLRVILYIHFKNALEPRRWDISVWNISINGFKYLSVTIKRRLSFQSHEKIKLFFFVFPPTSNFSSSWKGRLYKLGGGDELLMVV